MVRINKEYHRDAKNKIIAAALEIATENGWNAVTLEAISLKIGVTPGALYTYYENRDELMQEVFLEVMRKIRGNIISHLSNKDLEAHEVLEYIADNFYTKKNPISSVFMQSLASIAQDPRFRDQVAAHYAENIKSIDKLFLHLQKKGQIPANVSTASAARAVYGLTMGLGLISFMQQTDRRDTKKIWVDAVERILLVGTVTKRTE